MVFKKAKESIRTGISELYPLCHRNQQTRLNELAAWISFNLTEAILPKLRQRGRERAAIIRRTDFIHFNEIH